MYFVMFITSDNISLVTDEHIIQASNTESVNSTLSTSLTQLNVFCIVAIVIVQNRNKIIRLDDIELERYVSF